MNIYAIAMQAMKPTQIDHRNSDLYLLMTNESMQIVSEYRKTGGKVQQVVHRRTGLYWYRLPWAYMPYWQRHFRNITENYAWDFINLNEHSSFLKDWSDNNFNRTFSLLEKPPHPRMYPAIRGAIQSILSPYGIENSQGRFFA